MVQCLTCASVVSGSWQLTAHGVNAATTGINAYLFASSPNWIYCFCAACFSNGKFAYQLRSWYAGPINTIIQEEKNKIIPVYQQRLSEKDNEIQQLKAREQTYKSKLQTFKKILTEESQRQILKTQEYYKGLESSFKITSNQFFSNLSVQVNALIKKRIEESIKVQKLQVSKVKQQYDKVLQRLKQIRDQTLNSWRSAEGVQGTNLFSDEETQSTKKLFQNKIKAKEQQLKLLIKAIEFE